MSLKTYLSTLDGAGQTDYARRCGTSRGHLRNVSYGYKPASPELAVNAERESGGVVTVDSVLAANWVRIPDADWPHPGGRPLLDFVPLTEPAAAQAGA